MFFVCHRLALPEVRDPPPFVQHAGQVAKPILDPDKLGSAVAWKRAISGPLSYSTIVAARAHYCRGILRPGRHANGSTPSPSNAVIEADGMADCALCCFALGIGDRT